MPGLPRGRYLWQDAKGRPDRFPAKKRKWRAGLEALGKNGGSLKKPASGPDSLSGPEAGTSADFYGKEPSRLKRTKQRIVRLYLKRENNPG